MQSKDDIAVITTFEFIRSKVPDAAHILDLGAGRGRLASYIRDSGFKVTAIDKSDKAVAIAAEQGSKVAKADIGTFTSRLSFDAAIFSMSIHHLYPLESSLKNANSLLRPGSPVLIEEFAVEEADDETAKWFYQKRENLGGPVAAKVALKAWISYHKTEPAIHSGEAMIVAVNNCFSNIEIEWVPYFYRYLAATACDEAWKQDPDLGKHIYNEETRLINLGRIKRIGLRIAAVSTDGTG